MGECFCCGNDVECFVQKCGICDWPIGKRVCREKRYSPISNAIWKLFFVATLVVSTAVVAWQLLA
jgi:hypothetical protein